MKKERRISAFLLAAAFLIGAPLAAQTKADEPERDELYYTYAGIIGAGGYSYFSRTGWIDGREQTKKSSGAYGAPGLVIDIFVRDICGEITWQYWINSVPSDEAVSFSHSVYTATAKYCYEFTPGWSLAGGAGLYFEGAPSEKSHGGAGGEITAGGFYSLRGRLDMKFFIDGRFRIGFYGQDAKSTRMGYGGVFGITAKLGRS